MKQEWQSSEDIKFCFAANFDIAIRFCFLNPMRPQGYLMRLWNNRLTGLAILYVCLILLNCENRLFNDEILIHKQ